MTDPKITPELIRRHGFTDEEYNHVVEILGREPSFTELGIFSVMWSEHCSYKSSRVHLKRLPTKGDCVVQGPGENAGIVDIGGGLAAAFKIESHNHPSFIEPYQGAATGVGGILRDIFTMGARPVAAMNSLHFGSPVAGQNSTADEKSAAVHNRSIIAGVVRGIGDYGNAFGVPTVGGEVHFSDCYARNPLVNAFTLGLVRKEQIFYGRATGVGNPVIYVGAKTGRDGIHGATMASEEFGEEAQSKRPTVQVGDPFLEKLLLEACLEAMRNGAVIGIQDMGAAGLTCSSCEMAARAGNGIEIDLDLVPQRETGMSPYEIMLSESQERMLIVADAGREREVLDIFKKWELDAVVIGKVTDGGRLVVKSKGLVVASIPNLPLADEAPMYTRPLQKPVQAAPRTVTSDVPTRQISDVFMRVVASLETACKEWVYRQYDHMVRTNTVVLPGSDAAVIRIKETRRALAMTLDSNARYCQIDPRAGARLVIAEACRNIVASGGRPLALTNCLNFASPERPEIMWQFSETIDGIAEACKAFGTPVTGGNVSFYNETEGRGIYSTPVIGMIGIIEDLHHITTQWFKEDRRVILLLGSTADDLGASRVMELLNGKLAGNVPKLDLCYERRVHEACLQMIQSGLVESAHDCSDGGLAVTLAESAFSAYRKRAVGFEVNIDGDLAPVTALFSETPARIVVSVEKSNVAAVQEIAAQQTVPVSMLGETGGDRIRISVRGEVVIDLPVAEVESAWRDALPRSLEPSS
ncbi:MAG TPA: phosphoribosylformylglycinamidine synthase subunit PurL [Blastocatellia bacterium]|nr:phosphoribosylformylglycinamidine synthase subunit PurL [Blastocatellia bacterium]